MGGFEPKARPWKPERAVRVNRQDGGLAPEAGWKEQTGCLRLEPKSPLPEKKAAPDYLNQVVRQTAHMLNGSDGT